MFRSKLFAHIASIAMVGGLLAPAAVADEHSTSGEVRIGVMIDGVLTPADPADIAAATAGLPDRSSGQGGDATPQLIDWNQWFGCFSLNHEDDVFAQYVHWWDGESQDVRLKCGTGGKDSGWGYKHIRGEHEQHWQDEFDAARAAGWDPRNDRMESWDDLMSFSAGQTIRYPEFRGGNTVNKTRCGVSEVIFYRVNSGEPVYSFRTRAVWASDSDRLITSFPQKKEIC